MLLVQATVITCPHSYVTVFTCKMSQGSEGGDLTKILIAELVISLHFSVLENVTSGNKLNT